MVIRSAACVLRCMGSGVELSLTTLGIGKRTGCLNRDENLTRSTTPWDFGHVPHAADTFPGSPDVQPPSRRVKQERTHIVVTEPKGARHVDSSESSRRLTRGCS